jgi:ribonuclease T1
VSCGGGGYPSRPLPASGVGPTPPWIAPGSLAAEEGAAVEDALGHIRAGTRPTYGTKWGVPHWNNEGRLPGIPGTPGAYREFYVRPAPGTSGPGARRLVIGQDGNFYYTWDHYRNFVRVQ